MSIKQHAFLLAALTLVSSPALSQPAPAAPAAPGPVDQAVAKTLLEDAAKDQSLFDFSYGAPESPVLPLVGVAGDQITKVESFRKFGLSVFSGSSSDDPWAYSLDFSPYWRLASGPISLEDYQSFDWLERAAARAKAAVAVSGGKTGSIPSTLLFSVSTKFGVDQDPLMAKDANGRTSFETCLRGDSDQGPFWVLYNQAKEAGNLARRAESDLSKKAEAYENAFRARYQQLQPQFEAAYGACEQKLAKEMARKSSFDAGAGLRLNGEPGKLKDFKESGAIVWATYATGVLNSGSKSRFWSTLPVMEMRGVVHGRYTFDEAAFDDKGLRKGTADASLVVAGLENMPHPGGGDSFRWSLQAGWNRQESVDLTVKTKDYWRYLAVAQAQVAPKVWLKGTVGRVEGRGVESDTYFLLGFSTSSDWIASAIEGAYSRNRF